MAIVCFHCFRIVIIPLTLSKAVFVGANTVKGPAPWRVSTRPAAWTAVNRVENLGLVATMSATVFGEFLTMDGLEDREF